MMYQICYYDGEGLGESRHVVGCELFQSIGKAEEYARIHYPDRDWFIEEL